MKNLTSKLLISTLISLALTIGIAAQSRTNRIYRPCPGTTTPGSVLIDSNGDLRLNPCPASNAYLSTINLSQMLGGFGSQTTGALPYWTGTTFASSNVTYNSLLGTVGIRPGSTAGADFGLNSITIGDLNGFNTGITVNSSTGEVQLYCPIQVIMGANASSIRAMTSGDRMRTTLSEWDFSDAGGAGFGVSNFLYLRTITAGGTTGNQTINKPAGTVNIAGGANTVTVTNSTVSANSVVFAVARTNDATCSVKNVVPAAGSFIINMTANCTAETSVGFLVTN